MVNISRKMNFLNRTQFSAANILHFSLCVCSLSETDKAQRNIVDYSRISRPTKPRFSTLFKVRRLTRIHCPLREDLKNVWWKWTLVSLKPSRWTPNLLLLSTSVQSSFVTRRTFSSVAHISRHLFGSNVVLQTMTLNLLEHLFRIPIFSCINFPSIVITFPH